MEYECGQIEKHAESSKHCFFLHYGGNLNENYHFEQLIKRMAEFQNSIANRLDAKLNDPQLLGRYHRSNTIDRTKTNKGTGKIFKNKEEDEFKASHLQTQIF